MENKRWYELNIRDNLGMKTVYHEYPHRMDAIIFDLLLQEHKGKIIGVSSCSEAEYKQKHIDSSTNDWYIQDIRDNIAAIENHPYHLDTGLDKKKVNPRYKKYL